MTKIKSIRCRLGFHVLIRQTRLICKCSRCGAWYFWNFAEKKEITAERAEYFMSIDENRHDQWIRDHGKRLDFVFQLSHKPESGTIDIPGKVEGKDFVIDGDKLIIFVWSY